MGHKLFADNQVVALRRDLLDMTLCAGTVGTVVMVYPMHLTPNLPQAYEVEFCDEDGITLALETLTEDDLTAEGAMEK